MEQVGSKCSGWPTANLLVSPLLSIADVHNVKKWLAVAELRRKRPQLNLLTQPTVSHESGCRTRDVRKRSHQYVNPTGAVFKFELVNKSLQLAEQRIGSSSTTICTVRNESVLKLVCFVSACAPRPDPNTRCLQHSRLHLRR